MIENKTLLFFLGLMLVSFYLYFLWYILKNWALDHNQKKSFSTIAEKVMNAIVRMFIRLLGK